jgi:hypothetical protein
MFINFKTSHCDRCIQFTCQFLRTKRLKENIVSIYLNIHLTHQLNMREDEQGSDLNETEKLVQSYNLSLLHVLLSSSFCASFIDQDIHLIHSPWRSMEHFQPKLGTSFLLWLLCLYHPPTFSLMAANWQFAFFSRNHSHSYLSSTDCQLRDSLNMEDSWGHFPTSHWSNHYHHIRTRMETCCRVLRTQNRGQSVGYKVAPWSQNFSGHTTQTKAQCCRSSTRDDWSRVAYTKAGDDKENKIIIRDNMFLCQYKKTNNKTNRGV